jgi:hypothetical protein
MYIHTYIHTYIYTYTYINRYAYRWEMSKGYDDIHTYTYIHTYMGGLVRTKYICTYIRTYLRICIYVMKPFGHFPAVGIPARGIIDELARKPALSHVRNHAVCLLLELHPVALSLTDEDADRNEGVGKRHNPEDEGEHDEEALSGRYWGHVTKGCRPQKKRKSVTFLYQVTVLLTFFF